MVYTLLLGEPHHRVVDHCDHIDWVKSAIYRSCWASLLLIPWSCVSCSQSFHHPQPSPSLPPLWHDFPGSCLWRWCPQHSWDGGCTAWHHHDGGESLTHLQPLKLLLCSHMTVVATQHHTVLRTFFSFLKLYHSECDTTQTSWFNWISICVYLHLQIVSPPSLYVNYSYLTPVQTVSVAERLW